MGRREARFAPSFIGRCLSALVLLAIGASGAAAEQVISTSGPINNIWLTDDLGCQATQTGDTAGEFYGGAFPGACGTFLSAFGTLYGPSVPGGNAPVGSDYSPQGQSAVLGDGSPSNPYEVVTVVNAGATGVSITQTDSYVVGQPYYRTDITVTNTIPSQSPVVNLYHAGDCDLQGSDSGYGWYDSSGQGIYCTANPNNSPAAGVVGFEPLNGIYSFVEGYYASVWSAMTPFGANLPDTCDCTTDEDNGAGLSWPIQLGLGPSDFTASLATFISPTTPTTPTTPSTPTTPTTPGQSNGAATGSAAQPGQPAGTPVLGQSFNAVPVSGQVLVKVPGSGFAPLTQSRLLATGTQIDTLSGKVELISASGKRGNTTQNGTFSGGIFSVSQARSGRNKGLVTAKLLDASCKTAKAEAGPLAHAAVSGNVLSTLHSTSHGKYSSSGHYGSATSRGTAWTLTDRCKSTLISVQKDTVLVHDFVHHRSLKLHTGQHYLITAKR